MAQQVEQQYFVGLDLGQASDPTALAVPERPRVKPGAAPGLRRPPYALRHLQRFQPGTPYQAVIEAVRQLPNRQPLPGADLVLDQTGVGRAVVGLVTDGLQKHVTCTFVPVTITAGGETVANEGGLYVPRKELVGVLQVLLQNRRLALPRSLPDTDLLIQELVKFKARVTLARDPTVESCREGPHDDLVLALGLAARRGESLLPPLVDPPPPRPMRVRA
jgi:hypothetical protein